MKEEDSVLVSQELRDVGGGRGRHDEGSQEPLAGGQRQRLKRQRPLPRRLFLWQVGVVQLPRMLLQVEVSTEPLSTYSTSEWLLLVVCVHVKCQVIDLVERL